MKPRNLWESTQEAITDCALAFVLGFFCMVLMCSGCATTRPLPSPGLRDGAEQAVAIAWKVYGRTDIPPLVRWVQGEALSCTDPNSGKRGFPVPWVEDGDQACREGLTMSALECMVAWDGTALSFSETVLTHELGHVALARMGVFDPKHRLTEWWGAGGKVDQANERIREAGR